jgi:hypothetical protein
MLGHPWRREQFARGDGGDQVNDGVGVIGAALS